MLLIGVITLSLMLLIYPIDSMSQTGVDDVLLSDIPGGLIPENNTVGPVGNVGAEYKFDEGFYQKIQDIMREEPRDGDPGVYDGERYYSVIAVVSRDDGDGRNQDDTANENKNALVKRLELLGARDIVVAESLSFVTASIPVAEVPGFSLHDAIYGLGDGELRIISDVDRARITIHATPNEIQEATGVGLNGSGVVVAVLDTGIMHDFAFDDRIIEHVACYSFGCRTTSVSNLLGEFNRNYTTHGTQVAQVLGASGLSAHNGIAPGVNILDIQFGFSMDSVVHSLDYALKNGADVVNMSFSMFDGMRDAFCRQNHAYTSTMNLIINEAVDKGMVTVKTAGNRGVFNDNEAAYESITNPGCGHNIITVGGINDRGNTTSMYINSSRGHVGETVILKPELVAPAYNIQTISFVTNDATHPRSGTSYAAPQVSATAAMLLQLRPDLTPIEIKAAILLGANWTGPVTCTSSQYEQSNLNDNCSHAVQPSNINVANNDRSLNILNNVGFGILDVAQTLEYASIRTPSHNHIMGDYLESNVDSKQYAFSVTDTFEPVTIILTWLVHPHGGITEQSARNVAVPVADLGFTITEPGGRITDVDSTHQTKEFIVFRPSTVGNYTITVTGSNIDKINKPVQNYAIASTHSLAPLPAPFLNAPPAAQDRTVIINPNSVEPAIIRLAGADANDDPISFSVSRDPVYGVVSTGEQITTTTARMFYNPSTSFTTSDSFTVIPQDGLVTGRAATITVLAESPPSFNDVPANSTDIVGWDTHEVTAGYSHMEYSQTFQGPTYPVSAIYLGSVNMEGVDVKIVTTTGTYNVAVPASDVRMLDLVSPIIIKSLTLSADGLDEESAQVNQKFDSAHPRSRNSFIPFTYDDVRMFAGYVPAPCAGAWASSCPTYDAIYTSSSSPSLAIPDNTDKQDTVSAIQIPVNGTISSLSLSVDITHTYIGDLNVALTSPNGTNVVLHNNIGSGTDDINTTYLSTSHTGLKGLIGGHMVGNWTLSIGDYAGGDSGTLNSWGVSITYSPNIIKPIMDVPVTPTANHQSVFSEDFESSLSKWIETGEGDWRSSNSQNHGIPITPGHGPSNLVLHSDNCDTSCTLTLNDSIDLTKYSVATLSFWRFVDSGLDTGEYLKVELYDGSRWSTIYNWSHGNGDDNRWNAESYDLASYLDASNFNIRLVTKQSTSSEDVQVDDIVINTTTSSTPPPTMTRPSTISEDFESNLDGWMQSGNADWTTRSPTTTVPGSSSGNKVAYSTNCRTLCTMTLSPVDLSSRTSGYLILDRFVSNSLDSGEYLKVELYNGSSWTTVFDWQASAGADDSTWRTESYRLNSSHLTSEVQLRITARSSSSSEVVMVDNISIQNTPATSTLPASYSVYVADTDDREVLVFSSNGTYQGVFIPSRSGDLGRVWDVSFGPDGHLYVSDNSNYKIRKYDGNTGSPLSSSTSGWASTVGFPNGLEWYAGNLYVATGRGVEKFSSSGSSLGYMGDASRSPSTTGAKALLSAQDVAFCQDGRMYVTDKAHGEILYYRASDGKYMGSISGTATSTPDTTRATGLECGPDLTGSGYVLYQSGGDSGRVNEINLSTKSLIRTVTSLIDEPYGMDMRGNVLYVANKDDDNIIKLSAGISSIFASENRIDDLRGLAIGPVYSGGGSSSDSNNESKLTEQDVQNDEPEITLMHNGTATYGPIHITSGSLLYLVVHATDPDNDVITITVTPDHLLPSGVVAVTDHLNGTASILVNTSNVTSGSYVLWVSASDQHGNYEREPYGVIIS